MANEVRLVANSGGIIADLLLIDFNYAEAIVYDDNDRTSGNVFIWKSSGTKNDGTVYDADPSTGGVWEMQYDGPVNVKWFLEPGSSVIDTTADIQKVLDTFKEIQIPEGTYTCNKLTLSQSDVNIYSENAVLEMDADGTVDSQLLEVTGTNIKISSLVFDAADKQVYGCLCTVKPNAGIYFYNCIFKNIKGQGKGGPPNSKSNMQYGIVVSLYNVKFGFNNCTFIDLYNINSSSRINTPGAGLGYVGGIYFGEDDFSDPTTPQKTATNGYAVSNGYVENCFFENIITILDSSLPAKDQVEWNDADCIRTYGYPTGANKLDLVINNCTFKNYSKRGIKISNTDNLMITNTRYIIKVPPRPVPPLPVPTPSVFDIIYKVVSAVTILGDNILIDNVNVISDQALRHRQLIALFAQKNITVQNVFCDYADSVITITPGLYAAGIYLENFSFYNISCANVYYAGIRNSQIIKDDPTDPPTIYSPGLKNWTIEKCCLNAAAEDVSGNPTPPWGIAAIELGCIDPASAMDYLCECRMSDINITNGFIRMRGKEYTFDGVTIIIDSPEYGYQPTFPAPPSPFPNVSLMELQAKHSGLKNNLVVNNVLIKVVDLDPTYYTNNVSYLVYFRFDYGMINNFRLINESTASGGSQDIVFHNVAMLNNNNLQYDGPYGMNLNGNICTSAEISNASFRTDALGDVASFDNIEAISSRGPLRTACTTGNIGVQISKHYDGIVPYSLTGSTTIISTQTYTGVLCENCAEFTLGTNEAVNDTDTFLPIVDKYYVWSIHAFLISGDLSVSIKSNTETLGQAILKQDQWVCSYGIRKYTGAGVNPMSFEIDTTGLAGGTVRIADLQVVEFDNFYEAQSFVNSKAFAETTVEYIKVKAFGNIGTGTTFNESYNIASVSNSAVGQYIVNFVNPLNQTPVAIVTPFNNTVPVGASTYVLSNSSIEVQLFSEIPMNPIDTMFSLIVY